MVKVPITADHFPTPPRQAATSFRQVTEIDVETAHHGEMRRARPRHGGAKHRTQMLPSSGSGQGGLARKQLKGSQGAFSFAERYRLRPICQSQARHTSQVRNVHSHLLEALVRESDAP
jgi:hypothetical protein